jgi:peptidoglycan/xylan/chitin deacetylase (PgdA/CDA1 family)
MRAILTFHSVDDSGSVLSFPPRTFSRLLEALHDARLPVLDLDALLDSRTQRGVALTFDDGMRSVFTHALPVLRDHGAPAHVFLTTGAVGRQGWATPRAPEPAFDMLEWDEVEKLQEAGVRLESHTHSHPDLRELDDRRIAEECDAADGIIEERLGRRPRYFAYPFGHFSARARDLARDRYRASVTTQLRPLGDDDDPAALPRLDSYYLRAPWVFRRLDAPLPRLYLGLRGVMRRIRGSECRSS